jgi:hypothetical protein
MSLQILKDTATYQSWYARVSGTNSYQEGYPFDNCTTYRDKPWLEWRSGYSDQNAHTMNVSTSIIIVTGIALIGCNFSSVVIDGVTRTLVLNRNAGDYRGIFSCSLTQAETWTIPAQSTVEGYFRINAIVMGQISNYSGYNMVYPLETEVDQNAMDIALYSGRTIRNKLGQRKHVLKINCNPIGGGQVSSICSLKYASARDSKIIVRDDTATLDKTYYCRRQEDIELNETFYKNYRTNLLFREI